jgi:assimilatory nitrate reductase catalytic subunit
MMVTTARNPPAGAALWWSQTPCTAGFKWALSGWTPLADFINSEQALRQLLGAGEAAELASYSDPRRGIYRYGAFTGGTLEACVFFGPAGSGFTEMERAVTALGAIVPQEARLALLAGLNGVPVDHKIVCSCFSVSEAAIRDAIATTGLCSPAEIGAALQAGTNCGSCIPELKKLLAATSPMAA